MIGRLRGILAWKQAPFLLLDVQGVGYEIEAPMSTFYELPAIGTEVTLCTQLIVREDAHLLYGFASERERALFRALLKISGIGARIALAILSGLTTEDFARCVRDGDLTRLTRVPGVGKKTAERLVIEMRDRLNTLQGGAPLPDLATGQRPTTPAFAPPHPVDDAVSALIALGYKPPEASRMVLAVEAKDLSSEDLIRRALQAAGR